MDEVGMAYVLCLVLFIFYTTGSHGVSTDEDYEQKYRSVLKELEKLKEEARENTERVKIISNAQDSFCRELGYVLQEEQDGADVDTEHSNKTEQSSKTEQSNSEPHEASETGFPIQLSSLQVTDNRFELVYNAPDKVHATVGSYTEKDYASYFKQTFSEGTGVISGETGWDSIILKQANFLAVYFGGGKDVNVTFHQMSLNSSIREIVEFEPGKTATVKFKVASIDFRQFSYVLHTPSREEPNTVMGILSHVMPLNGIINSTESKKEDGYTEITFVLNEGGADFEGILTFTVSDLLNVHGFAYQHAIQILQVIRSDHTKPFPDGYLGFEKSMVFGTKDYERCRLYSKCSIHEKVLGDRPADITLWRVVDGQKGRLDLPGRRFMDTEDMLRVIFLFENVSRADEGQYLVQATSVSGTVIEKEFQLKIFIDYTLLEEQSKVLKVTRDELIVQCVGRGYPEPAIRFYTGDIDGESYLTPGKGVSIKTSYRTDDFLMTAVLTLQTKYVPVDEISCTVGEAGTTDWSSSLLVYEQE